MTDLPDWAAERRSIWHYRGQERPPFAQPPEPGQESVWDYPRPPEIRADDRRIFVRADDVPLAETKRAFRVLETASPPTFYVPAADVRFERLEASKERSACEWKGLARYWSVRLPDRLLGNVAWDYPDPFPEFVALRDCVCFYPARVACFVDDTRVEPQPGPLYGGWVTPELVGPFKGSPGSEDW